MINLFYRYIFPRVAFLAFWYYRVTMWLTRPRHISEGERFLIRLLPEIPRYAYTKDGWIDSMRHPLRVGLRIVHDLEPGDCDDFAAWRCWYACRQLRRDETIYLCILRMSGHAGHVLMLVERADGTWEYADYGLRTRVWHPEDLVAGEFDPIEVGKRITYLLYGERLRGIAMAKCSLNHRTGIAFGRVKAWAP